MEFKDKDRKAVAGNKEVDFKVEAVGNKEVDFKVEVEGNKEVD